MDLDLGELMVECQESLGVPEDQRDGADCWLCLYLSARGETSIVSSVSRRRGENGTRVRRRTHGRGPRREN